MSGFPGFGAAAVAGAAGMYLGFTLIPPITLYLSSQTFGIRDIRRQKKIEASKAAMGTAAAGVFLTTGLVTMTAGKALVEGIKLIPAFISEIPTLQLQSVIWRSFSSGLSGTCLAAVCVVGAMLTLGLLLDTCTNPDRE